MIRACAAWTGIALLSVAFAYAAVTKIADPRAFQEAILDYRIIGIFPAALVAWWLPWFELLCALALWWRPLRNAALLGIAGMLVTFLAILSLTMVRGLDISCGCFGLDSRTPLTALLIDLGLLAVCAVMATLRRGRG